MRYLFALLCVFAMGFAGCRDDGGSDDDSKCEAAGDTRCSPTVDDDIERCEPSEGWLFEESCSEQDLICVAVPAGAGGYGGSLTAECVEGGSGGTGGSGGSGGAGGTGGTSSCAEVDIPGEPNLTGTLSISPTVASFDDFMTVMVGVDADTREVTASLLNESSGVPAGFGFASTSGNETVPVMLLVETTAQPGPHTLEVELRADPQNAQNYILYAPGDGDTYVRIKVEDSVQGPETPTSCLEVNATIE
jgi:hypothetical protein